MKRNVYQVITDKSLRLLDEGTVLVVFAGAQAQKASDYILGVKYDQKSD